ncbi:Plant self-incompatibility S1 [Melia azedarach]|uniref:Plant self-incompatibility S1 n=1 Tax=Melia azedarach TaxID=155640 RepID=A0ACC1YXY4_MELAZ|nr:Plant self-incompatibility S1 [Melia azedarach]
MKPLTIGYLLLLVLALSLCQLPIANSLFNKFSVHIINGLNNQTIDVHCKSRDDDLGLHHLPVHGEFMWKFRVNIKSSTLYFCKWKWVKGHKTFDVFTTDEQFLGKYCGYDYCRWQGREDGLYGYSEKRRQYVFAYKWDP